MLRNKDLNDNHIDKILDDQKRIQRQFTHPRIKLKKPWNFLVHCLVQYCTFPKMVFANSI